MESFWCAVNHPWLHSSLSCVSTRQTLIEFTSKISLPLWQWSYTHTLFFSLLPPCSQSIAPSSLFRSFFSLSLSISHLLLVGGWSVTLLCAHWPVARWWFIAEEGRGFRRWGWWMARFKITCGGVWKRSMMNECDLWTPIKMVSLQRTVGFRSSQRFCAALSSSNDLFIASVLHSCVLG